MEKVRPEARLGQGSDPSSVRGPGEAELLVEGGPAPDEGGQVEVSEGEALGLTGESSTLLKERGCVALQPSARLAVRPRAGQSEEATVLLSLGRRAARAVRPFVQGAARHELWVVGFGGDCERVGLQRLVPGEGGERCAYLFRALASAVAMGARAMVLVQNRPGPRSLATPVDFASTLKLAAAAHLVGITLVDHLLLPNGGGDAPVSLREQRLLPEATALAAGLETALEALATEHGLADLR